MASIDKIYGTEAQRAQLYAWVRRHRPKALRYVYSENYAQHLDDGAERAIANFLPEHDAWLARKCPLPFVLERIGEQYSSRKTGDIARQRLSTLPPAPSQAS